MANNSIESGWTRQYPLFKTTTPHVEINYNADALRGKASDSTKNIAIIGSADNGIPNHIYEVTSLLDAKRIFGSGSLIDALELAWSPNGQYVAGGGTVYAERVEDAQAAHLTAGGLTFNSTIYSQNSNKTAVKMDKNPLNGSYSVTVQYAPDNYTNTYTDLGRMFLIQYHANDPKGAKATYSIVKGSDGKAIKMIVDVEDADEPSVTTTTTTDEHSATSTTAGGLAATGVKFDSNAASVKTGDEIQLSWKLTPDNAQPKSIEFNSDNKASATVDDKGKVKTLADGKANITIKVTNANGSTVSDAEVLTIAKNAETTTTTTANAATTTTTAKTHFALTADVGGASTTTDVPGRHHYEQVFDLTSTDYNTVFKLMNGLSLIPNMEIELIAGHDNSILPSSILDEAKDVNIMPDINDVTKQVAVWGVQGDIADKLAFDEYVSVQADVSKPTPDPFGLTPMTGGTTGRIPISWADKIKQFGQVNAYFIVPLTSSAAVHAEVKAFVNDQHIAGHSMRAFVGGGYNENVGTLISRQLSLKDERIALVGTSGYRNMNDGRTVHLPAYMMAALTAGVDSGLQIGGALTNKYIDIVSVDQNFTQSQYDQLNENGVIMVQPISNRGESAGFRYVQDVTTNNATNEPVKARISLGEITDFLFDDLRFYLEQNYIGQNIRTTSADILRNAVGSFLDQRVREGLLVKYNPDDIQVTIQNDIAWILFTVVPSQTLDEIVVYGAYEGYSVTSRSSNGSITLDANGHPVITGDLSGSLDTTSTSYNNAGSSTSGSIKNSQNPDINAGYGFGEYDASENHDSSNGIYN